VVLLALDSRWAFGLLVFWCSSLLLSSSGGEADLIGVMVSAVVGGGDGKGLSYEGRRI
jgi:hypothetical protein